MKADKTRKTVSQSVPVSVFNQVSVVGSGRFEPATPPRRERGER
jgi:hypothetical protein